MLSCARLLIAQLAPIANRHAGFQPALQLKLIVIPLQVGDKE
jgi:hypothetical protein